MPTETALTQQLIEAQRTSTPQCRCFALLPRSTVDAAYRVQVATIDGV